MKRKTILFILIVTFCFTGCKKIDQNTENNEQTEESVIDDNTEFVSLYDVTTPAYECKEEIGKINIEQKKIASKDETVKVTLNTMRPAIQLNDSVLQLYETTMQDIFDNYNNDTFHLKTRNQEEITELDKTISKGDEYQIIIYRNENPIVMLSFTNTKENDIQLKDTVLSGIYTDSAFSHQDIYYPGSIYGDNNSISKDEIIEQLKSFHIPEIKSSEISEYDCYLIKEDDQSAYTVSIPFYTEDDDNIYLINMLYRINYNEQTNLIYPINMLFTTTHIYSKSDYSIE